VLCNIRNNVIYRAIERSLSTPTVDAPHFYPAGEVVRLLPIPIRINKNEI